MSIKVVIVGGVAGGASAAARLRRLDENAEIILFEKGQHISFANCGLPYYIGEVITEKENLFVTTPEKMKQRFAIDVRVNSEVLRVDPVSKIVEIKDHEKNRIYTESYDKLVLSPGAEPIRPQLPGINSSRIFTLRNIPDTYSIKDYVDKMNPQRAVVVGAGFIGLEMAENLHLRGINVSVVELADHVIGPMDFDMAAIVHNHLRTKNVELILKDAVSAFDETETHINVTLSSGKVIKADMVIMGIGVRPDVRLAADAGLTIGSSGGIRVNEYLQTSDPDIYAVGDAIQVKDYISQNPALIPLAGPANKQGRIAADNICGGKEKYEGTQGTSIVKVFDLTVAVTGNGERLLQRNNIQYEKSFTHSASHASYYPGGIPMSIKLLFEKSNGKLLGAQIVGYDGVDKRIDILSTAIRAGMTVYDLEKLELAYAPPFSSAKDPVNIAGFTASNILQNNCKIFHWNEVDNINKGIGVLLDVREQVEFQLGTINGAVNIPLDGLRGRLHELPKDKTIFVFCQVGLRGYLASRILTQNGFEARNLSGGLKTYGMAVEKQTNEGIFDTHLPELHTLEETPSPITELDACGLQCPGPIMKVFDTMKSINENDIIQVKATDPAFQEDIKTWCNSTGNQLLDVKFENKTFIAKIKKGIKEDSPRDMKDRNANKNNKSMIVFSNDLDKAIASFIIANGAASMGRKVTMFFTFWGLNILRKPKNTTSIKKDFISRMFGVMMPKGSRKLSLSKMNMAGIGPKMIRNLMNKKNIYSLEELLTQAQKNGVEFVACNMSMDIMGIKKEELIDGVTIGGVASFLGSAEESDMSLFI
ncbi:CoA-disulfide reductase [Ruminiclostridium cellulolyticum]|uniref:FAD-dependent pyridine nucleotide-disulphide oxidoreductase n=1 Tax=Ruminiclostridium cellulolyticum (strain ATCC 35319 / DSM 5812 / JCM 6584 / H10) TaxID=394503 RepID=B8I001_RUMCH|nr:CoA-disulfide reductase [Ruminiclostridium cellulolyticum]ACL75501.1 FAD-dependent pyridine nucleotide-disulphide oxidoreductase [Ruminiclostridium cellulolyticum H10]